MSRRGSWAGLAVCLCVAVLVAVQIAASRHARSVLPSALPPAPAAVSSQPGVPAAAVPGAAPTRSTGATPHVPVYRAALTTDPAPVRPTRLVIDSVHLNVAVDLVGVRPDGSLDIPADVRRAGWYRYGSGLDDRHGAVVVVGHVDGRKQGLGAFAALASVRDGDRVVLQTGSGRRVTYRITQRALLAKATLPVQQLFGRSGPHRLSLITCAGPYIPSRGGYQDNLVLVAMPLRP